METGFILLFVLGSGFSFGYVVSLTAVRIYFDGKWVDMALSIVQLGAAVGSTAMSYLLDILNQHYGLNGCFIAYAGVLAQSFWCAALLKPKQNSHELKTKEQINESVIVKLKNLLRQMYSICTNKSFLCNSVGVVFQMSASTVPAMLLVDYYMEIGYEHGTAVFLVLIMYGAGLFGRILPGFVKLIPRLSYFVFDAIVTIIGGIAIVAMTLTHDYTANCVLVFVIGWSFSTGSSLYTITLAKLVPISDYSTAMGISATMFGIGMSVTPPIAGKSVTMLCRESFIS